MRMNQTVAAASWVTLHHAADCKGCGTALPHGCRVWMYPSIGHVYGRDCCDAAISDERRAPINVDRTSGNWS